MSQQKEPSRVWIEIDYDPDRKVMEERIEELNRFAERCGMLGKDQRFFFFEHKGQEALGFVNGPSGEYQANRDWGRWFNLTYLASLDGN